MNGDPTANQFWPRAWPIWLFVAMAMLLNVAIPPLIGWLESLSFEQEIQSLLGFAGFVVGDCCFVVLVSGFTKRTWLGAYLFGLVIAGAGYAAILCGFWLIDGIDRDSIAAVAFLPAYLLAGAGPLYVLRHFFGWRLVYKGDVPPRRQPMRLADIFSLTAIVAAALVLARVPAVVWEEETSDYWLPIASACLMIFGTSLIVLPLHARIVLRDAPLVTKLAWLGLLAIIIVVVVNGILQCSLSLDMDWDQRLEILPFVLTFLGAAIGMFYLALLLLAASGVRLLRGRPAIHEPENNGTQPQDKRLQQLTWWRIGGAVAVTMATSIFLANLEQSRAALDKQNEILAARAVATGGELGIIDRIPTDLTMGYKATDDDLAAFQICHDLERLSLQNSKITDRGLENLRHFPQLRTLHLESVKVSDDGLVHLKHFPNLETLQIVNCDVKGTHIAGLPNKQRLTILNLTRTQFGDNECELLAEFSNLHSLTLAENEITDASLPHLAANDLVISGTHITFNGLLTNRLPNVGRLRVAKGHFTPEQLSQLEQQLGAKVTVEQP